MWHRLVRMVWKKRKEKNQGHKRSVRLLSTLVSVWTSISPLFSHFSHWSGLGIFSLSSCFVFCYSLRDGERSSALQQASRLINSCHLSRSFFSRWNDGLFCGRKSAEKIRPFSYRLNWLICLKCNFFCLFPVTTTSTLPGDSRGYRSAEEAARELTQGIRREGTKLAERWAALRDRTDRWNMELDGATRVNFPLSLS